MIQISKIDDLSFTVRFDPQMAQKLSDIAIWGTVENALILILSDALIITEPYGHFDYEPDDDIPF